MNSSVFGVIAFIVLAGSFASAFLWGAFGIAWWNPPQPNEVGRGLFIWYMHAFGTVFPGLYFLLRK